MFAISKLKRAVWQSVQVNGNRNSVANETVTARRDEQFILNGVINDFTGIIYR